MFTIPLLLLAFAVSLDSFSVGFTYGLRKMKIPLKSIVIISCCSALSLLFGTSIGHLLETFVSVKIAEQIGGVVLIFLGGWILYQFFRSEKSKKMIHGEKTIVNFEIKSLGIVINILKKPLTADFDQSGSITGIEAFMLGVALSLDAFGAGVGAVMLGFSPILLAITVALMSSLFVLLGINLGGHFSKGEIVQKFSFIPGILLILIGIWKM